jgi:hypothetical protein
MPPSGFSGGPLRDYALPVAAVVATLALPFMLIAWTYVVVGHAHFLMAYLYQWRGKKMNARYAAVAGLLLLAAGWYFFLSGYGIIPILLAAGILFAFHFAIDEVTLHGERFTRDAWIAIAGFTLLFSSLIVLVAVPGFAWSPQLAIAALGGSIAFRLFLSRAKISGAERYLWFVGVLLAALALVFGLPASILGVVLLLHFINWYVGFGKRLRSRPEKARSYWLEVASTLGLSAALFAAFLASGATFFSFAFGLGAYYAWAIAHILLSFVSQLGKRAA